MKTKIRVLSPLSVGDVKMVTPSSAVQDGILPAGAEVVVTWSESDLQILVGVKAIDIALDAPIVKGAINDE